MGGHALSLDSPTFSPLTSTSPVKLQLWPTRPAMLRRSLLIAHLGPSRVLVSATSYRALSSSSARPGRGPSNFGLLDAEDSVDFDSDIHSRSSGRGSPSSRGRKERSSSSFGSRKPKSTGTDSTFLRPLDGRGEEGGSQLWKRSGDFDSDLADIYGEASRHPCLGVLHKLIIGLRSSWLC